MADYGSLFMRVEGVKNSSKTLYWSPCFSDFKPCNIYASDITNCPILTQCPPFWGSSIYTSLLTDFYLAYICTE